MFKDRVMWISLLTLLAGFGVFAADQAAIGEIADNIVKLSMLASMVVTAVLNGLGIKSGDKE